MLADDGDALEGRGVILDGVRALLRIPRGPRGPLDDVM